MAVAGVAVAGVAVVVVGSAASTAAVQRKMD